MKNASVIFRGMNRRSFDNATENGWCEELINVRSENGRPRIIPQKNVLYDDLDYDYVLEHVVSGRTNLIGHKLIAGTGETTRHAYYLINPISGSSVLINTSDYGMTSDHDVFCSCLTQFFVVSDRTAVRTIVFRFNGTGYENFFSDISLNLNVSYSTSYLSNTQCDYLGSDINIEEIYNLKGHEDSFIYTQSIEADRFKREKALEFIVSARNRVIEENNNYSEGYVITFVTISLWDEEEIPYGSFVLHKLGRFDTYKDQYNNPYLSNIARIKPNVILSQGTKITYFRVDCDKYCYGSLSVNISCNNAHEYKELIKSVNIYSSIPKSHIDFSKSITFDITNLGNIKVMSVLSGYPEYKPDGFINNETLYFQKSFNVNEISSNSFALKFNEALATNKTLDVMSYAQRAGHMFNYNKRLHYFGTKAKITFNSGMITSQSVAGTGTVNCDVYVFLRIDGVVRVVKFTNLTLNTDVITQDTGVKMRDMFVFPDSRAYRIVFKNTANNRCADASLESSKAYNYSYSYMRIFELWSNYSLIAELAQYSSCTNTVYYDEDTAINVTAQNNPIFFPVTNSYSTDHQITDLAVAFEEISAAQAGQYPVFVFTKCGIYALQQGAGDVLYASLVPISADSVTGDVRQTGYGVIYVSDGSVKMISGRQTRELSEMIDGEPDMHIRNNSSYPICCKDVRTYDVTSFLSGLISGESGDYLRAFLNDCVLNWSSAESELIISKPRHEYSYVLNLKYNSWYKVGAEYLESHSSERMLQRKDAAYNRIVDYAEPVKGVTKFHIQTRPIMLEPNTYSKVVRAILNIKANIQQVTGSRDDFLSFYVFASDDGFTWKCVGASQKKNCDIKGVRLDMTSKSHRYFVLMAGGNVMSDTETANTLLTYENKLDNKIR